ncbi:MULTISPECIES: hypothetical protein [Streptomyces]|uniref:hypothetical protein n=1 Tax=Streptomyces TaxID=1883 RepID=UPI0036EE3846
MTTTAANVNNVTQTLTLLRQRSSGRRPGRTPRKGPDALRGDKDYDSDPHRS